MREPGSDHGNRRELQQNLVSAHVHAVRQQLPCTSPISHASYSSSLANNKGLLGGGEMAMVGVAVRSS